MKRTFTFAWMSAAAALGVLAGCSDQMLPAEDVHHPTGTAKPTIVHTSPISAAGDITDPWNWGATSMTIDGSGQRVYGTGIVTGQPRHGKFIYEVPGAEGRNMLVMRSVGSSDSVLLFTDNAEEVLNFVPVAISPDGSKVAIGTNRRAPSSTNDTYRGYLYVVDANGTNLMRIADNLAQASEIAFSPDGRTIAYYGETEGLSKGSIYTVSVDGGTPVKVAGNARPSYTGLSELEFSNDGGQILFTGYDEEDNTIVNIVNADGTGLTNLTPGGTDNYCPTFSPDGRKIAYVGGPRMGLVIMNRDGSGKRTLVEESPELFPCFPEWSPDGREILYSTRRVEKKPSAPSPLNRIDVGSGAVTPIGSTVARAYWVR